MRRFPVMRAALCAAAGLACAGAPEPARAESPVVLEGADADARDAILELLPDRDPPQTLFDAERIAEEAAARAQAWLRAEGYYAGEATPEATDDPPAARLRIAPGARFRFAAPDLNFDGAAPDEAAKAAARNAIARLAAGAPARAQEVLDAEAAAIAALRAAGYADAQASPRRVVVDHASQTMTAQFQIAAGPRVLLGQVRVLPDGQFRPGFLRRLRNWQEGEPYAPDKIARLRRDMVSTGAAARVTTRLDPEGPDGRRNVVLEIEPAKRNAYEVGIGWSTTEGLGVEAEWTRRNVSRRADSLTYSATLGERAQSAGVELERPHAAGLGHAQRFSLEASHEDTDAYSRQGVALSAAIDAEPRLSLGLSYGVSLSADTYDDAAGVENALVLSSFLEARRDATGNPLDARDGYILEARLEPSVSTGDATLGFVRATSEARAYQPLGDDDEWTLAARTRVGWVEPVMGNENDLPLDRRFYAGGGGSVRGYDYNSIYPESRLRSATTPGGQGLFEVSAEARYRFAERYGVVAFVDGGNAFDFWEDAADLRWGAGIGFRYDLGFAPLRIDLAAPLDRREGDASYALYISLGQAF